MLVALVLPPVPHCPAMALQNNGCAAGCGTLLALFALGFVLAYWQVFLALGLLALVATAAGYALLQWNHAQLRQWVTAADLRLRHDPCSVQDRFGVIQSLTLTGDYQAPKVEVRCQVIAPRGKQLESQEVCINLGPPAQQHYSSAGRGAASWLRAGGITHLDDLSVEAKAVRAAMECLKEREWTGSALARLDTLRSSVVDTLAKAEGNELLEPSIPQLQQALVSFNAERGKLHQANRDAAEMLCKLHDFLSVPEGIRPILSFDLDQLFDPQRLCDLEQSFSEVVLLNDAFRQLSQDALA